VVAEEVRNLAGRSAKAARETAQLIETSVERTRNGAQIAGKTSTALEEILAGINKASALVDEIAKAGNDQAQGIAEVTEGLDQIDTVTQNNTATAESTASAAVELSQQASEMQKMLASFTLLKGHRPGGPAPSPEVDRLLQEVSGPGSSGWGA
jgi:methyl-accepting chemotaxis protein